MADAACVQLGQMKDHLAACLAAITAEGEAMPTPCPTAQLEIANFLKAAADIDQYLEKLETSERQSNKSILSQLDKEIEEKRAALSQARKTKDAILSQL
jgi:hypothetical protein